VPVGFSNGSQGKGTTAIVALGFLVAVLLIALIANGVEKARTVQPAE
jgi:hypothetical protein